MIRTGIAFALVLSVVGCGKKVDCEKFADHSDKVGNPAPGRGGGSREVMLQMCKDGDVSEKQYECAMGTTTNSDFVHCFSRK
jgi:hypothetical protein